MHACVSVCVCCVTNSGIQGQCLMGAWSMFVCEHTAKCPHNDNGNLRKVGL